MSLNTMQDLFIHELRDLMSAERQLTKALPKMAKAATNEQLVEALESHLEETKQQIERLEECFEILGVSSRGKKCKGMEGLIEEGSEAAKEPEDDNVRDAAIIGAAQRVEHYEMAGYGTARAFAERLGYDEVVALLDETLEEESAANEKLTEIAETEVNYEATDADSEEDEASENPRRRNTRRGGRQRAAVAR